MKVLLLRASSIAEMLLLRKRRMEERFWFPLPKVTLRLLKIPLSEDILLALKVPTFPHEELRFVHDILFDEILVEERLSMFRFWTFIFGKVAFSNTDDIADEREYPPAETILRSVS